MGVGKSYWAKEIAGNHKLQPFDLDELIEEKEGANISQIFNEKGEEYFRNMETTLLASFKAKNNFILATGGGTLASISNMKLAKEIGTVIYLKSDFETLYHRIKNDPYRPLSSLSKEELEKLMQIRELTYSQAHFTLDTMNLTLPIFGKVLV